ncbi:MAG: hypothetical protein N3F09_01470 [Bacteroidia bacterium]|nr:hypothetical protein [Bacteroidia bacterium]
MAEKNNIDELFRKIFKQSDEDKLFPLSEEEFNKFSSQLDDFNLDNFFSKKLDSSFDVEPELIDQNWKKFEIKYLKNKFGFSRVIPFVLLTLLISFLLKLAYDNIHYKELKKEEVRTTNKIKKSDSFTSKHASENENKKTNTLNFDHKNFEVGRTKEKPMTLNIINNKNINKSTASNQNYTKSNTNYHNSENNLISINTDKKKKENSRYKDVKQNEFNEIFYNKDTTNENNSKMFEKNNLSVVYPEKLNPSLFLFNVNIPEELIIKDKNFDSLLKLFPKNNKNSFYLFSHTSMFSGNAYSQKNILSYGVLIGHERHIHRNVFYHFGIGVNIIHRPAENFVYEKNIEYSFGKKTDSTVIQLSRANYISIPFMLGYTYQRFSFNAGISWEVLLSSNGEKIKYIQENADVKPNLVSRNRIVYLPSGINNNHFIIFRAGAEYKIHQRINLTMDLSYLNGAFINISDIPLTNHRILGLRVGLKYKFNNVR